MSQAVGNDAGGLKAYILILLIPDSCLLLASLYYSQPILADIAQALAISPNMVGSVITMSQIGYIAWLLFLAPVGDFIENRTLCAAMTACAACATLVAALTAARQISFALFSLWAFLLQPRKF